MQNAILQFRFLALGLFLIYSALSFSQDTATLTGTIRDNTSAVIPDAPVALKNIATGIVHDLKTNSAGEYVAAAVASGTIQPHCTGRRISQVSGQWCDPARGAERPHRRDPAGWKHARRGDRPWRRSGPGEHPVI